MSNGGIIGPVNDPIVSVASSPGTSTFTASGPYTSPSTVRFVEVFMVGGGGGGQSSTQAGAGGSGGGIYQNSSLPISVSTNYPIVIGGGGASSSSLTPNPVGAFGAAGGLGVATTGFGQTAPGGNSIVGTPGAPHPGGNSGGTGLGGGGGAGGVGANGCGCSQGGAGGPGLDSSLSGSPVKYGAGGSSGSNTPSVTSGVDGGAAGASKLVAAGSATVNRGGGGGGMRSGFSCGSYQNSSAGSSGIAFVKELTKTQASGVWPLQCQYNFKKQGNWS